MFRSSTVTLRASGSTALNGTAPAGVAVGDLLIAFVVLDGVTSDTVTPPLNWTSRGSFGFLSAAPDGSHVEIFTKRVVGGESYAFTTGVSNDAMMIIGCWTNIDWTTSPIPGLRFAPVSTVNTTANATPVSVAAASGTAILGDDVAWFAMLDITVGTDTWGFTPPTGYTEQRDGQQGFAIGTLATRDKLPVGAVGTLTGTGTRSAGTGAAGWGTFVVFIATLPNPSPQGLSLVQQAGWKPQRWDFPLGVDLLLDDFLPSAGGGGPVSYPYTASGGIVFGGASIVVRGMLRTSAGGLQFGGAASVARGHVAVASGGLQFGGAAVMAKGRGWPAAGGLQFGGAGTVLRGRVVVPAGGLQLGGAAVVVRGIIRAASGGLTFSGAATVLRGRVLSAAGGLVFSGVATAVKTMIRLATGGIVFGGSSPMQGNTAGGGGTPNERARHWVLRVLLPGGR